MRKLIIVTVRNYGLLLFVAIKHISNTFFSVSCHKKSLSTVAIGNFTNHVFIVQFIVVIKKEFYVYYKDNWNIT